MSNDFRVQQTYDEIRHLIEETALSVIGDDAGAPSSWYDEWARGIARIIADSVVMHLDAAEDES